MPIPGYSTPDNAFRGYTPPSTMVAIPANVLSMGNVTPATGIPAFFPIDVGPKPLTIKALWCNVTTAQAGGTGTLVKGAVYSDDGTGGAPLLTSAGKLAEVTFTVTSTGIKQGTLSSNLVLPPGRYWVCGFYYQGSTAPTTAPQMACASNATALWCPNNSFAVVRYLVTAAVTDLPVASQTITGSGASTGMVVGMQAV